MLTTSWERADLVSSEFKGEGARSGLEARFATTRGKTNLAMKSQTICYDTDSDEYAGVAFEEAKMKAETMKLSADEGTRNQHAAELTPPVSEDEDEEVDAAEIHAALTAGRAPRLRRAYMASNSTVFAAEAGLQQYIERHGYKRSDNERYDGVRVRALQSRVSAYTREDGGGEDEHVGLEHEGAAVGEEELAECTWDAAEEDVAYVPFEFPFEDPMGARNPGYVSMPRSAED